MLTDTEEKVFGLLETYAIMDTDGLILHSGGDPMEVPKAIGGLLKKGMIRVLSYHRDLGDKIPHFGRA